MQQFGKTAREILEVTFFSIKLSFLYFKIAISGISKNIFHLIRDYCSLCLGLFHIDRSTSIRLFYEEIKIEQIYKCIRFIDKNANRSVSWETILNAEEKNRKTQKYQNQLLQNCQATQAEIATLETQRQQLRQHCQTTQAEIATLETQRQQLHQHCQTTQAEIATLETQRQQLRQHCQTTQAEIATLEAQRQQLHQHCQTTQAEIATLETQRQQLRQHCQATQAEIATLETQYQQLLDNSQEMVIEIKLLEAQCQQLRYNCKNAQREIEILETQYQQLQEHTQFLKFDRRTTNQDLNSPLLVLSMRAIEQLCDLYRKDKNKYKKVYKTLKNMMENLCHPGLQTHKIQSKLGPSGEDIWTAYVENKTPSAWRVFWYYGPGDRLITIDDIVPHP